MSKARHQLIKAVRNADWHEVQRLYVLVGNIMTDTVFKTAVQEGTSLASRSLAEHTYTTEDYPESIWIDVVDKSLEKWVRNEAAKDVWQTGLPGWFEQLESNLWSCWAGSKDEAAKEYAKKHMSSLSKR
jgi:hypothetical protein